MIQIALCDDDSSALPVIAGAAQSAFESHKLPAQLTCFHSGRELLQAAERTEFDLVLLDIDMPDLDGIEVGKRLRERHRDTEIIYVSECESRVFESFAVHPFGFVRKSNFFNDIATVVQLYQRKYDQNRAEETLRFATRTGQVFLNRRDICYIEGSGNYQLLYLASQQEPVELKMTMDKLEYLTGKHGFIRIHKGYLVNYLYIQRIQTQGVTLKNGVTLPVGRSKTKEVKARYLSLLES